MKREFVIQFILQFYENFYQKEHEYQSYFSGFEYLILLILKFYNRRPVNSYHSYCFLKDYNLIMESLESFDYTPITLQVFHFSVILDNLKRCFLKANCIRILIGLFSTWGKLLQTIVRLHFFIGLVPKIVLLFHIFVN